MALKRSMLTGMGLTEEQVTAIIEGHDETVKGLKEQIDNLKDKAAKADDYQKQLAVWNRKYNNFPMRPLAWLSPKQALFSFPDVVTHH